ncbi:MAG TPA: hypothetical protein VFY73_16940 [Ideonella sp.]|uniref:hypothetical protein n=1 Tax=Ideonella sp. TaxID=1929293 RepID=UPI002E35FBAD|nr:hypothetical protein [Ideonella sp.]HEX5685710.1 hypothetical protein [Ideonella sp.]
MTDDDRPTQLTTVPGGREALERELLWNIALDGDIARRAQLYRMLTPAANTEVAVAPDVGGPS